jgi:hypothetical protein
MVHPGTLFRRRQRGIPMHSYENRSQIRALPGLRASASHSPSTTPRAAGSAPMKSETAGSGSVESSSA